MIRLELENIPALQEEAYMPPKNELGMRVEFYYILSDVKTPEDFWKDIGKRRYEAAENFIGKHGEIARAVAEITRPDDPPETKLRKIYARVQQIRNLSHERSKTEKEEKREKRKENDSVKDVLKNGYGTGWEINCLFVALARAAGFQVSVAYLSDRAQYFFNPQRLDADQLDKLIAVVRLGDKDLFLDPATLFSPFGLLSWENTRVQGLRLDKSGGTFIQSSEPTNASAIVERKAKLQLLEDGGLEGNLRVIFTGQEALSRRIEAYDEDEAGKRKQVEEELKEWLPAGSTVKIESIANWESAEEPLQVECSLQVPNFAVSTGRRLLLPAAVFQVNRRHPFQHAQRVHAVYFHYPYEELDDITIELPAGYRVESLPPQRNDKTPFALLEVNSQSESRSVRFRRRFAMEGILFRKEYYGALRSFFDKVKASDEEKVVLETAAAAQRN